MCGKQDCQHRPVSSSSTESVTASELFPTVSVLSPTLSTLSSSDSLDNVAADLPSGGDDGYVDDVFNHQPMSELSVVSSPALRPAIPRWALEEYLASRGLILTEKTASSTNNNIPTPPPRPPINFNLQQILADRRYSLPSSVHVSSQLLGHQRRRGASLSSSSSSSSLSMISDQNRLPTPPPRPAMVEAAIMASRSSLRRHASFNILLVDPVMTYSYQTDCVICLEPFDQNLIVRCSTSGHAYCEECLALYFMSRIESGFRKMPCCSTGCSAEFSDQQVQHSVELDNAPLFARFQVMVAEALLDPKVKICPRCSSVQRRDCDMLKTPKTNCTECTYEFCFPCQAPWHEGISCKKFQKGDAQLKKYVKQNGNWCPRCKAPTEKTTGCDHMTCSRCNADWCYACGCHRLKFGVFGNHHSKFSLFGCKKLLFPGFAPARVVTRSAITLGGVSLAVPVVAGAIALAIPVGVPVLIHRKVKRYRQNHPRVEPVRLTRAQREWNQQQRQELALELERELRQMNG